MCKLCVRSIQASPSLALEQCTVSSNKCALQLLFPFCERKQSGGKREACCLGIYLNFFFLLWPLRSLRHLRSVMKSALPELSIKLCQCKSQHVPWWGSRLWSQRWAPVDSRATVQVLLPGPRWSSFWWDQTCMQFALSLAGAPDKACQGVNAAAQ